MVLFDIRKTDCDGVDKNAEGDATSKAFNNAQKGGLYDVMKPVEATDASDDSCKDSDNEVG
eukprot:CAMPEP_0176021824 /NCGR_PEP_ID=MMETSP0120_2-20121206/10609_1 /TAXON_ID=160619 /ORGANISM="Kryptoperidinium foliaceum, Strain CCMP 1326" /LENGTH=60 /DNA_ID=CAMNT_0017354951 /DNA_START=324 /DNA_END=506 /DNA_ORIENTATION=-